MRDTEHFFLDMGKMNEPLLEWINDGKEHWRPNVLNFTRGQLELRELRGRAITRDLDWGVTIPVGDYPDKRIYVWFDAVIGYLQRGSRMGASSSASRRRGANGGMPTSTRRRALYNFIGKDNIPFHTIIWPGMLIGYNHGATHLNLPYDVPANEYLNLGGGKFSTSRGNVIGWNTVLADVPGRRLALRADGVGAGDRRRRVHLAGLHGPRQQRAGGQLGQPGQPHARLCLQAV